MKRSWIYPAALVCAFAAAAISADPRGPFCLNDDFVFANVTRDFLSTGSLRLSQWQLPANIPHVLTGAFFGLFAPASNENLRCFNMLLSLGVAIIFFHFLVNLGLLPLRALAGAALLLACPIFLAMSMSFHADINSLLWEILALWLLVAGLRSDRWSLFLLASCFLSLFALNRQSCLIAAFSASIFLACSSKTQRGNALALFLPATVIFLGYLLWFWFIHGPTWAWLARKHTPALSGVGWLSALIWTEALLRFNACLQTAACFLSPLSLALLPSLKEWKRPGKLEAAALAGVVGLCLLGWNIAGGMPLLENTLSRKGLGVLTLNNPEHKFAGLWGNPWAWKALDVLGLLSSLILTRLAFLRKKSIGREVRAILSLTLPPFLILLILPHFYDRYLLIILPGAIAAALLGIKDDRLSIPLCLGGCALLGFVSCVGLKDYFAWNRARWQAGIYGISLGLRPEQIENGFDWDGQFSLEPNMQILLARKPPKEIDVWDWQRENKIAMLTSFSDKPPRSDFESVKRFGYTTPFSNRTQFVYLFALRPAKRTRSWPRCRGPWPSCRVRGPSPRF